MLNYLDRSVMNALAPTLEANFHFDNHQYGWVLSAFSIAYAFTAPVAGIFIDRVGLNLGAMIAVTAFSCVGAGTGLAGSVRGLLVNRIMFGVSAASGLPLYGKANAMYLEPSERAFGTAMNQVGISLRRRARSADCRGTDRSRLSLANTIPIVRSVGADLGASVGVRGEESSAERDGSRRRRSGNTEGVVAR